MNKELLLKIAYIINDEELSLEDCLVEVDNVKYSFENVSQEPWDDQGKYQHSSYEGQLCRVDEDYNTLELYDYYIDQSISRSGSYYSDWYYDYQNVRIYKIEKVLIPEEVKVIPAHYMSKRVYEEI